MKRINWRAARLSAVIWRGFDKTWMRNPTAADLGNTANYLQMVDNEVITFSAGVIGASWNVRVTRTDTTLTITVYQSGGYNKVLFTETKDISDVLSKAS